ncbi:MAG: hypothetical protein AB9866_30545 [Syntrophobacteraceae bacterium]
MAAGMVDKSKSGYVSVEKRFPEARKVFERLFESSQSLRSLCDEYEACMVALEYWRESSLPEAPDFRNEFSSLLSELEEEILEHLTRGLPD